MSELKRLRDQVHRLSEAAHVFLEARKHGGYGMEDAEKAVRAALAPVAEARKPRRHVRMFQQRFLVAVNLGEKCQTIRKWPKRDADVPRVGDVVDCRAWLGLPYRSKQTKIAEGMIQVVRGVEITDEALMFSHDAETMGGNESTVWVISPEAAEAFARADGFASMEEMRAWFREVHGLPFLGVMIKWDLVNRKTGEMPA